ncbi:MAG: hypothetical protein HYW70_02450 [Candidatus Nealsonbacteria bacterium]|nr:hypothetical protein [Candidatus Nealsonbacteria bacterium]
MPFGMLLGIIMITAGCALIGVSWGLMEIKREKEEDSLKEIKKYIIVMGAGIATATIGFIQFISYVIFA